MTKVYKEYDNDYTVSINDNGSVLIDSNVDTTGNLYINGIFSSPADYTGSAGVIGPPGSIGYTGSRSYGFVGSLGYTGSVGSQGYTGSIGDIGLISYTGSIGYSGSVGSIGYTGSQIRGYTGSAGPLGLTGSIGYVGSTGYNGPTGLIGNQGYTGSTGHDSVLIGYACVQTSDPYQTMNTLSSKIDQTVVPHYYDGLPYLTTVYTPKSATSKISITVNINSLSYTTGLAAKAIKVSFLLVKDSTVISGVVVPNKALSTYVYDDVTFTEVINSTSLTPITLTVKYGISNTSYYAYINAVASNPSVFGTMTILEIQP